jgi:hypothetical protein
MSCNGMNSSASSNLAGFMGDNGDSSARSTRVPIIIGACLGAVVLLLLAGLFYSYARLRRNRALFSRWRSSLDRNERTLVGSIGSGMSTITPKSKVAIVKNVPKTAISLDLASDYAAPKVTDEEDHVLDISPANRPVTPEEGMARVPSGSGSRAPSPAIPLHPPLETYVPSQRRSHLTLPRVHGLTSPRSAPSLLPTSPTSALSRAGTLSSNTSPVSTTRAGIIRPLPVPPSSAPSTVVHFVTPPEAVASRPVPERHEDEIQRSLRAVRSAAEFRTARTQYQHHNRDPARSRSLLHEPPPPYEPQYGS